MYEGQGELGKGRAEGDYELAHLQLPKVNKKVRSTLGAREMAQWMKHLLEIV